MIGCVERGVICVPERCTGFEVFEFIRGMGNDLHHFGADRSHSELGVSLKGLVEFEKWLKFMLKRNRKREQGESVRRLKPQNETLNQGSRLRDSCLDVSGAPVVYGRVGLCHWS